VGMIMAMRMIMRMAMTMMAVIVMGVVVGHSVCDNEFGWVSARNYSAAA
jgi:hypothetical protein